MSKIMTRAEANKKIEELLQNAYDSISQAEAIAQEYNLTFRFELEYGMGGYYDPNETNDYGDSHWHPSSLSC